MEAIALWAALAAGGLIVAADHVIARAYRRASYRVRMAVRGRGGEG